MWNQILNVRLDWPRSSSKFLKNSSQNRTLWNNWHVGIKGNNDHCQESFFGFSVDSFWWHQAGVSALWQTSMAIQPLVAAVCRTGTSRVSREIPSSLWILPSVPSWNNCQEFKGIYIKTAFICEGICLKIRAFPWEFHQVLVNTLVRTEIVKSTYFRGH